MSVIGALQTRREIASGARRPSRAGGANAARRIRAETLAIALAVTCPSDRLPAECWPGNPHDLHIFFDVFVESRDS
jgi:hypothetical protein